MKTILRNLLIISLLSFPVFNSCDSDKEEDTAFLFTKMDSDRTKINFKNFVPVNELTNSFVYEYVYNGGGVAVGDINNDGLDDIYFTSNLESNRLYLNLGNLEFKDVTEESNTQGKRGWSTGTNMVDVNNDGLLDIYVCKSGPYEKAELLENELFINQGPDDNGVPTFNEQAREYGLNDTSYSIHSAFLDFDLDGDLDMYLMNHNPQTFAIGTTETFSPLGDKFYENQDGFYKDITREVGIYSNAISYGLGVGVGDLNNDGWPDLYISNDYDEPDYMYINQQNGKFIEVVKNSTNHISNFSMGNDIADFDNDGYLDVMTLDMVSEDNYGMKTSMASMNPEKFNRNVDAGKHYQYMYNTFLKHTTHIDSIGIPYFSDVGQITGVTNTDWSWASLLADFDNDGLKDLFITNGIKKDFRNKDYFNMMTEYKQKHPDALTDSKKIIYLLDETPERPKKNYFYKNNSGLSFSNMSEEWSPSTGEMYSQGAAYADLDNDGDLDIIVNNMDEEALILRNNSVNDSLNYIQFEFDGLKNNTKGLGVKIEIFSDNKKQIFENYSVRGYQSSVPPYIHVGLGSAVSVDSVLVYWPRNMVELIENPTINSRHKVTFESNKLRERKLADNSKWLTETTIKGEIKHQENDYNDYQHQVLLPHKMSQFGPAIAVGDINSDGLDDLFVGNATGFPSVLYSQTNSGDFRELQVFHADDGYEDVDAEFFDFDNDGDLDLYVVSGGNEFEPISSNYSDRLYENRNGKFIKTIDLLPADVHISGSIVKVQDIDGDGFKDLFIGGRHIPHQYPAPASSVILLNKNGKFINETDSIAPELNELGLVNDAEWTDYDNDGDFDLIVVGEWMKPTIFQNNENKFIKTEIIVNQDLTGWYYSIAALDIDNDGDMDYLLGNLGNNYKYKANQKEPFEVYYHDFDDNGKDDLVLGYYNFGELFPVRGRECSSQQMAEIKKIAPTYDDFGKSTIEDIYGVENLKEALHFEAFNFSSGILKNNGSGNFDFIPFPEMAQISSVNDFILFDIDSDQDLDIILAGNLFTSEIETPRNDAGYGLVLLNEGNFNYNVANANVSGFFVPTDVKQLRMINIRGKDHILVGSNDAALKAFEIN